jgi:hypothetical protein
MVKAVYTNELTDIFFKINVEQRKTKTVENKKNK